MPAADACSSLASVAEAHAAGWTIEHEKIYDNDNKNKNKNKKSPSSLVWRHDFATFTDALGFLSRTAIATEPLRAHIAHPRWHLSRSGAQATSVHVAFQSAGVFKDDDDDDGVGVVVGVGCNDLATAVDVTADLQGVAAAFPHSKDKAISFLEGCVPPPALNDDDDDNNDRNNDNDNDVNGAGETDLVPTRAQKSALLPQGGARETKWLATAASAGWTLIDDNDDDDDGDDDDMKARLKGNRRSLRRAFVFKDFKDAFGFFVRGAVYAEKSMHAAVRWQGSGGALGNVVTVTLSTMTTTTTTTTAKTMMRGLSCGDFNLAMRLSAFAKGKKRSAPINWFVGLPAPIGKGEKSSGGSGTGGSGGSISGRPCKWGHGVSFSAAQLAAEDERLDVTKSGWRETRTAQRGNPFAPVSATPPTARSGSGGGEDNGGGDVGETNSDDKSGDTLLRRTFRFSTFTEAFGFMASEAIYAEKIIHHVEWKNVHSRVAVTTTTHDKGGVSCLDTATAIAMNGFSDGDAPQHAYDTLVATLPHDEKRKLPSDDSRPFVDSCIVGLAHAVNATWPPPDVFFNATGALLNDADVTTQMQRLPKWKLVPATAAAASEDGGGGGGGGRKVLHREFKFKGFRSAFGFMTRAALYAEGVRGK
jgi:4a-hydroxytetrahydrobiopterin dehydratase